MLDKPSDDQLCYPDCNISCVRAPFSVGAQMGLSVVFGLNILINVVGNSVVIISISHFKKLHSPTNLLVLSLAVGDLLVGVTVIPFSMTRSIEGCWLYGDSFCQLHSNFDIFLCSVSILHLVCISVDRHEAVCNPLHYTNITMSVGWLMVLVCWLVPTFNFGIFYFKVHEIGVEEVLESMYCLGSCNLVFNSVFLVINSLLYFFLPCSVIVCLYTKIFLVANEQLKKTENIIHHMNADRGQFKRSQHKAAKTLGIVVGVYIMSWMPCFLCSLIMTYTDLNTSAILFDFFFWLAYFNSTMNPIIYALFYPWFRKCFKLIIKLEIFSHSSSEINLFC